MVYNKFNRRFTKKSNPMNNFNFLCKQMGHINQEYAFVFHR